MERMVDFLDDSGVAKPVEGFGDLVVLINPAFEAARYKVLQERAVERSFFTNQFVTLAILTAENDSATGFWFPLGRTLGTLFDAHRNGDQRRMNVRVPGRCSDLVTHDLTLKTQEPKQTKKEQVGKPGYRGEDTVRQSVEQVAVIADVRKRDPGGVTTTPFSQVTLNPRSTYKGFNPLYNVRVDQRVIDGHGGIGHEKFITFLREFVIVNTERPTPSETK
jgi:hypothetical protein